MQEQFQQKNVMVLRPETRDDEQSEHFRDAETCGTAVHKARPSNMVPHLYERTVELYLDILDMQARAETPNSVQWHSFLREAEQVIAGLIRREAAAI